MRKGQKRWRMHQPVGGAFAQRKSGKKKENKIGTTTDCELTDSHPFFSARFLRLCGTSAGTSAVAAPAASISVSASAPPLAAPPPPSLSSTSPPSSSVDCACRSSPGSAAARNASSSCSSSSLRYTKDSPKAKIYNKIGLTYYSNFNSLFLWTMHTFYTDRQTNGHNAHDTHRRKHTIARLHAGSAYCVIYGAVQ